MNQHLQIDSEVADEIGGYFGLDLPCYEELYPDALKLQSGRAAIRAVLECANIRRVFLPSYICDSVIKAVVDSGAKIEFYALDESLYPKDLPATIPEQAVVLYVNYFGLCAKNIAKLLKVIPGRHLIVDNSQALFEPHEKVLATIYSPRKFVGVPDGGLLAVSPSLDLAPPASEDQDSIERMRPLLVRMAYSAREGYSDFQKIPISLQDTTPLAMSRLTQRLMRSISWQQVAQRRKENFLIMAQKLGAINDVHWEPSEHEVPMCYPLMLHGQTNKIRAELSAQNIFIPIYWQDALPRVNPVLIEARCIHQTLFLPIDQRMKPEQTIKLSEMILDMIKAGI